MPETSAQPGNYLEINLQFWDARLNTHLNSPFYDVEGFIQGKEVLREPELAFLGPVKALEILHLQCHFGMDSLALARLGGKVTAVDFSEAAIFEAEKLAERTGLHAEFICSDIYKLPESLDHQYDVVFTTYGTIGWLPDLQKWAGIVSHYLKPGGRLVMVEFHPALWMLDDSFEEAIYPYASPIPIQGIESGSYADLHAKIQTEYVFWNHGLSGVIQNLVDQGLILRRIHEYDSAPVNIFPNGTELRPGWYAPQKYAGIFPVLYALEAQKPVW